VLILLKYLKKLNCQDNKENNWPTFGYLDPFEDSKVIASRIESVSETEVNQFAWSLNFIFIIVHKWRVVYFRKVETI